MTVTLADLPVGAHARVIAFSDQDQPDSGYSQQLTRLGLIPGTELEVLRRAPLGDPIEIRFRGFSLAIRPSEATSMTLERLD